jgi:hypothetical protein
MVVIGFNVLDGLLLLLDPVQLVVLLLHALLDIVKHPKHIRV